MSIPTFKSVRVQTRRLMDGQESREVDFKLTVLICTLD